VKTRQQLLRSSVKAQSPFGILVSTIRTEGVRSLYTGGVAFCLSNASKSGIRFMTFDYACRYMPKDQLGKTTVVGNLAAGMCAGVAESVAVLTPGENLKTRLIDDRAGARLYQSTTHAIRTIIANDGASTFFQGVLPVMLKQSSNAMVRFTSYNQLAPMLQSTCGSSTSVVAGALAGIITVYCTMPFDNIKTQMQSLAGSRMYSSTWDCAKNLVVNGGPRRLWKGTTPRLIRLSVCIPQNYELNYERMIDSVQVAGAIAFTVYEEVVRLTRSLALPKAAVEAHGDTV